MNSETNFYCGLENFRQRRMRRFHWQEGKNRATHTAIFIALISILFIFLNGNAVVWGADFNLSEEIQISEVEGELPQKFVSFCVTNEELFLIPDFKEGDVKVYEKNEGFLKLKHTIGKKGYGSNDFSKPTYCFYDNDELEFAVLDHGIRKIFIYDHIGYLDFKRVDEVPCLYGGSDIQLSNNKLFIAGYISDQDKWHYELYSIDLSNRKTTFILPSYYKFGFKSFREFEIQIAQNVDIRVIGINGWFDIYSENAFFVWEGNLKIIKVNVESGEGHPKFFGEKPPHYVKPHSTDKLIQGQKKRRVDTINREKAEMSYVRNVFTSPKSKYILVIYEGPASRNKKGYSRLQFYSLDGDFIKEVPIQLGSAPKMWFNKEKNILYALSKNPETTGQRYFILKYKIY
jgi:hypothetical protein